MLSVVHNYYYLLALLIIHSFRTSICVCKYLYMLSVTFNDWRGVGLMTLTFPLTSAGPGPTSAALKFYIFSAEIAMPLRLMLIPVFHPGKKVPDYINLQYFPSYSLYNIVFSAHFNNTIHCHSLDARKRTRTLGKGTRTG